MNSLLKRSLVAAVIGVPVLGVCLLPALAQPSGGDPAKAPAPGQPPEKKGGEGDRPGPGRGERGERGQRSQWAEQYRQELREHPRLARALVGLHEAKDYIDKSPNDFGGHKATSIKAIDDAIKELKETMKFDPKRTEPEGKGEGPGDGPGKGPGKGNGEKKDKKND